MSHVEGLQIQITEKDGRVLTFKEDPDNKGSMLVGSSDQHEGLFISMQSMTEDESYTISNQGKLVMRVWLELAEAFELFNKQLAVEQHNKNK